MKYVFSAANDREFSRTGGCETSTHGQLKAFSDIQNIENARASHISLVKFIPLLALCCCLSPNHSSSRPPIITVAVG